MRMIIFFSFFFFLWSNVCKAGWRAACNGLESEAEMEAYILKGASKKRNTVSEESSIFHFRVDKRSQTLKIVHENIENVHSLLTLSSTKRNTLQIILKIPVSIASPASLIRSNVTSRRARLSPIPLSSFAWGRIFPQSSWPLALPLLISKDKEQMTCLVKLEKEPGKHNSASLTSHPLGSSLLAEKGHVLLLRGDHLALCLSIRKPTREQTDATFPTSN